MEGKEVLGSQNSLPDEMTEEEIEKLWNYLQQSHLGGKQFIKLEYSSTDSTPTTDYTMEDLEEELLLKVNENHNSSSNDATLAIKKAKPKTFLSKVILYDNVSHDRMLQQRIKKMQKLRKLHEQSNRRKQELFVRNLENKQNEWEKLDNRAIKKLEPINFPGMNFKFEKLYHSVGYPYQAAIQNMKGLPKATRMPHILPQITRQRRDSSCTNETASDQVFITRLPKKAALPSIPKTSRKHGSVSINRPLPPLKEESERKPQLDARFLTLASLLKERYSPHQQHA